MQNIKTIDAKTAAKWLEEREAVLIDVREPFEYQEMHITQSMHIPLNQLSQHDLSKYKDKKIIIHCRSGMRSANACQLLLSQDSGFDIYNLEGGITAWHQAGLNVKTPSKKRVISIDRQVQLTIGTGVLLGLLLGYFVYPGFLLLSAFFGGGLLYAGISGSCGLAILMSKMPWNK